MKKPTNPADKNQLKVLVDTIKNPSKGMFLGGPSAEEAEAILKKKFGYTDMEISKLKESRYSNQRLIESGIEKIVAKVLSENAAEARYYSNQLSRLDIDPTHFPTIKITNGNGQGINTLSLNSVSIPIIIKWLESIQSKLPSPDLRQ